MGLLFFSYLISIALHEFGHAYVAKKLGYKLNNVSFLPFGAELNIKQKFYKNHEILIAIAGPLVNVVLIFIGLSLWWCFPISYYYLENFVFSNIIICLFNLLPIYPLDGGRVFLGILSRKIKREKAEKIIFIISLTLSLLFFLFFIITLFFVPNYSVGIISIFLTSSCLNFNKSATYEKIYISRDYEKLLNKGSDVKIVALNDTMPIYKLPNYLDPNHFCIFIVFNGNHKVIKVIFEQNIEKILLKYDATTPLKDIK